MRLFSHYEEQKRDQANDVFFGDYCASVVEKFLHYFFAKTLVILSNFALLGFFQFNNISVKYNCVLMEQ